MRGMQRLQTRVPEWRGYGNVAYRGFSTALDCTWQDSATRTADGASAAVCTSFQTVQLVWQLAQQSAANSKANARLAGHCSQALVTKSGPSRFYVVSANNHSH